MSGEDCYINYCRIIGDVIRYYIDNITRERGITRKAAYWIIDEHIKNNSDQWRSGLKPKIPYEDPLCRIAYLYSIVPVNANLVEYVFGADKELQNYFDVLQESKGCIDICAFGGGPGTEMLGLAKRIEKKWRDGQQENQLVLDFLLLDQLRSGLIVGD